MFVFYQAFRYGPYMIIGPVVTCVIGYMIYKDMSWIALVGLGVLFLQTIVATLSSSRAGLYR